MTVCFVDSHFPWQKGAVENVNKLVWQYIPKGSNFNDFSDEYIRNVGRKLNLCPLKRLSTLQKKKNLSNKLLFLHILDVNTLILKNYHYLCNDLKP